MHVLAQLLQQVRPIANLQTSFKMLRSQPALPPFAALAVYWVG